MVMTQHSATTLRALPAFKLVLKRLLPLGLAAILLTCTGCATVSNWFQARVSPAPIELTILQVEPSVRPGMYTVAGNATLPDQSQITVAAVRLLDAPQNLDNDTAEQTYEILARQSTLVERGAWQTNLNLWRVAATGDFQEAWQISQNYLDTGFKPSPEVTFTATFDPTQQPLEFQSQVEEGGNLARQSLAQYNSDGELYLQASRTLTLALPTGSTAPADATEPTVKLTTTSRTPQVAETTAITGGNTTGESITARSRSDAPLIPQEFLR